MIVRIERLLSRDLVAALATVVSNKTGAQTAVTFDPNGDEERALHQNLVRSVFANPEIQARFYPKTVAMPVLLALSGGQGTDWQTEAAIAGGAQPVRTDLAVMIALSDPETYEGGAVDLRDGTQSSRLQLGAGDAAVFPAGLMRRHEAVTRGTYLGLSFAFQSLIRSGDQRAILADLALARQRVLAREPKAEEAVLLLRSHAALLRLWAETG